MKKELLTATPLPLALLFTAHTLAAEPSMQIPEGRIIDHPSIYPDITPSAGPRVIDGCDVFLTADYIYWIAKEDNLQYASTGHSLNPDHSVSTGSTKNLKFEYRTGFKAGIGFNFFHDAWDSLFNYTWFQSNHNKGAIHASNDSGLTPSFKPSINLTPADSFSSAESLWQLHFNVLDWELGRNFYISKFLSLRPFIGLKGTLQKQAYENTYKGNVSPKTFTYWSHLKSFFGGVGIRSGLNTSWHLSESWSLFGDLAFSEIWGQFSTRRKDSSQKKLEDTTDEKIYPIDEKNHFHTITPVLELALGFRKDAWFYQNRFHINIQAGWEEQIWWDQNRFSLDDSLPRDGNLLLQGLTARIRLDF